jgi:hypothetical protein
VVLRRARQEGRRLSRNPPSGQPLAERRREIREATGTLVTVIEIPTSADRDRPPEAVG